MATICLSMICRNEEHVIRRCIASWRDVVNRWVIIDTGSEDGTVDIVRRELAGVEGELFERPWVSMGYNRSELMHLSRDKADYHLVLDADETLHTGPSWRDELTGEAQLFIDGGAVGLSNRILRTDCQWRYDMAWHAAPSADVGGTTIRHVAEDSIRFVHHADGFRSMKTPEEKYAEVVDGLLSDIAENGNSGRKQYYLAQSYRDGRKYKEATAAFRERIAMGGWPEEVYWSLLHIARIDPGIETYRAAIEHTPYRGEAYLELMTLLSQQKRYREAWPYAERAIRLAEPNVRLFHRPDIYSWRIPDRYGVVAYWSGRFQQGVEVLDTLLANGSLPSSERKRVIENRRFCAEKLGLVAAA